MNRISNLGFTITINWNQDISISYEDLGSYSLGGDFIILVYTYSPISDFSFEDVFEPLIDEFNSWYSDNFYLIKDFIDTKDHKIMSKIPTIGNITRKINRLFKIDDLLNEDYDF